MLFHSNSNPHRNPNCNPNRNPNSNPNHENQPSSLQGMIDKFGPKGPFILGPMGRMGPKGTIFYTLVKVVLMSFNKFYVTAVETVFKNWWEPKFWPILGLY